MFRLSAARPLSGVAALCILMAGRRKKMTDQK